MELTALTTQGWKSVHQDDSSSQPSSFNCRGDSGNSRPADAKVGLVLDHRRRAIAADDARFRMEGFIEHGISFRAYQRARECNPNLTPDGSVQKQNRPNPGSSVGASALPPRLKIWAITASKSGTPKNKRNPGEGSFPCMPILMEAVWNHPSDCVPRGWNCQPNNCWKNGPVWEASPAPISTKETVS